MAKVQNVMKMQLARILVDSFRRMDNNYRGHCAGPVVLQLA